LRCVFENLCAVRKTIDFSADTFPARDFLRRIFAKEVRMHVKSRIMRLPLATNRRQLFLAMSGLTAAMAWPQRAPAAPPVEKRSGFSYPITYYRTLTVDGVRIFYREAGPKDAPVVILLHGFPTSSHMFRNLIPALADRYRVIAPDYPGYGQSDMPDRAQFSYTFDRYGEVVDQLLEQLGVARYAMYVMDYGAPVGWRLALKHPERITGLIVQNGNAYEEGLKEFWDPIKAYWSDHSEPHRKALYVLVAPETTKFQYADGVADLTRISPDNWVQDQALLDRPGNAEIQMDLFYDYRTNLPLYPAVQAYFRKHRPPTLIVWGKNDKIFPADGAYPYKRDLPKLEFHLIDSGHFALEDKFDEMVPLIRQFLDRSIS
jgi:pimeloyl-ACP methyl ester carboxylesterase